MIGCVVLTVSSDVQDMMASSGMFPYVKAASGMVLQHEYIQPERQRLAVCIRPSGNSVKHVYHEHDCHDWHK